MNYPEYSYPSGLLPRVARDIVLLRRRDFRQDAKACIENIKPPVRVAGQENIPAQGPCVITINHYHRPGFGAQWFALAVAALAPVRVHWIITGEFTSWHWPSGALASRLLLKRIAQVYGFTTMPPMPPRRKDVERRAASVRAVLDYVRRTANPVLGLAPEGHDPPGSAGVITRPAAGVGRFGRLLANAGMSFVPVAAYEADAAFHLRFGERYELRMEKELSAAEKDRAATQLLMEKIARLLPLHLRGEFA
jgi:hypothetical protein